MVTKNCTLVLLLCLVGCGSASSDPDPLAPETSCQAVQCFAPVGVENSFPKPVKLVNPILRGDGPNESALDRVQIFGNVVHREGMFRMSYIAKVLPDPGGLSYVSSYAEGFDGQNWTKPVINGTDNVIVDQSSSFSVFYDESANLYRGAGIDKIGTSPDMKSWTVTHWGVADTNDTSTTCVKFKGEFLCFVRNQGSIDGKFVRLVALVRSADWQHWTEKENIIAPTDWTIQPYGLQVAVRGDKLIGVLWWYHRVGTFNSELIWSEDGRVWHRTNEVFLGPTLGTWDSGYVAPAAPVFVDGTAYFYYTGVNQIHDTPTEAPPGSWAIGLATMAADEIDRIINN